ncbi:DUF4240 domain-containing protein [Bacillus sp. JJ722]|uniref:DUF4240 domain-containing protein n=1 Tax=Bacillus sp. JJ722 TaxID=3122973 RepID=UPI002FFD7A2A
MSERIVNIGDVFALNLPNGEFGAVRVLNKSDKAHLLATTPYMEPELPSIDNEILGEILVENRFYCNNSRALIWVDGSAPENFIYIGNIPLTKKEKKIHWNSFGEQWNDSCGVEAYLEWRWENDRDNFVKEIETGGNTATINNSNNKKTSQMMKDETFWSIISQLDFNAECDDDIIEPAIERLANLSIQDIKQFEEALAYKLYLLDTKKHAQMSCNEQSPDYLSADLFLYIRCSVINKGKEFFEETLKNPSNMPNDEDFEPLLSIASEAYTRKTGNEFDYITEYDY